jgi:transcriptional regulator with PAS, ATPase and Fis domain
MLRALQEKEIRPVGSTRTIPINVRVLAATNRDLEQAVAQGSFRRDLFFRLNVLSLRIPPLRERRQDIPLLAGHILERLSQTSGREYELSDDAMKALLAYDWPGNVRELENYTTVLRSDFRSQNQCCRFSEFNHRRARAGGYDGTGTLKDHAHG